MTANVRSPFNGGARTGAIPGVKHIIAVASGKGGVGKSTVAVNLAASLQTSGARVGLLDADIYGPSVPGMLGVDGTPQVRDQKLVPLEAYGMKLISIGLLAGADKAMVWRGPMVSRAIEQLLSDVTWGELDYLVVDLPPGTGDASLTLAQAVPLSGTVIVMTSLDGKPFSLSSLDAAEGLRVFNTGKSGSLIPELSYMYYHGYE